MCVCEREREGDFFGKKLSGLCIYIVIECSVHIFRIERERERERAKTQNIDFRRFRGTEREVREERERDFREL